MDAFERELMRRSPLAACVLEVCDHVFDEALMQSIWQRHHGRCYEDVLSFEDLVRLMRDALIRHGGSAHKLFVQLERRQQNPVDESNFYRKLANTPVALSRALLREGARRLGELLPGAGIELPACFDAFAVVAADGKKIKNAAKRLKPTRGYQGSLLGAKALLALEVRTGMAIAMSDSLDGLSNEVPLVPELLPQVYEVLGQRAILWLYDRQFDGVSTLRQLCQRPQDGFVVRMRQTNVRFVVEDAVERCDAQGRRILDEVGMLGSGKQAMRVRRLTLFRDSAKGQEDVVLLSNLLDRRRYGAADLLELYRYRWDIEEVFQQVTQTFSLEHLIGCQPQAVLLQFSYCLLLYNLMQVIKAYVAEDGKVLGSIISMVYLFDDVRTELKAWAHHTEGSWPRVQRDAVGMQRRLRQLLRGSWDAVAYTKASDKKPRGKPQPKLKLKGGHSSVLRAMQGRAAVLKS